MTVTLVRQDDTGTAVDANTYCTVAEFKTYHDNRGHSYVGKTDDQISVALIRATDYIDNRFSFPGQKLTGPGQVTQWPRAYVPDPQATTSASGVNFAYWTENQGFPFIPSTTIDGIDRALTRACAEYALRALKLAQLIVDQLANPAGGILVSSTKKLDVLEITSTFAGLPNGATVWSAYPEADQLLRTRGLILDNRNRVER